MVTIRSYRFSNRKEVEALSFDTAFLGDSFSAIKMNKNLWLEVAVRYYLDEEPDSVFVAEDDGRVVGYLFGCLDDKKKEEYERRHFPKWKKLFEIPYYYTFSSATRAFIKYYLVHYRKEKFSFPKNAGHVHINIGKEYRNRGIGTMLMETFFDYAKGKGTLIVHADSFLAKKNITTAFWEKLGFHEFSRTKTRFWHKFLPDEEVYLVCYVRSL